MDWREHATDFIAELLEDDGVLSLQDIFEAILQLQLQNLDQLEEFMQNHEEDFFIENGRVALQDPELETTRDRAVTFFATELQRYNERPNYFHFRGHIGQAEEDVRDFINDFYPREEFRNFLLAHGDVFVVFDDDTVSLIDLEAVNFFKRHLENQEGPHFMNFRGHVGQAPQHIIDYINVNYPGESFLEFLEVNLDVFDVDEEGCVFLNENED